jgi:glycosyltransferase involved in cell wall biosynthesis
VALWLLYIGFSLSSSGHFGGSKRSAILQVIPALDTGGAERTTIDVAAALVREGFQAPVASQGGRLESQLAEAGGELIRMTAASKAPQTIFRNALSLRNLIRVRNIKLVHARSRAPAWSALLAARWTGVPFVATYHGIYNAANPLKRFYNSVMLRGDAVIANSRWTADHIIQEYRIRLARLVIIPRGVDLQYFDAAGVTPQKISDLRKSWNANDDDFVILLPARLTRWKGQSVLIEALVSLKQENNLSNIRAVLAGDAQGRDAYEAELRKRIGASGLADRISIVGHVSDMAAAYAAADVTVSASTDPEAFGRVTAEASAMAKPVIAVDHGGARETVISGVSGFLVPPADVGALAAALKHLSEMVPDDRAKMGRSGRMHIVQNFSRERMCEGTIALYRTLLSP